MIRLLVLILDEVRKIRANTQVALGIEDAAACVGVSDKTMAKWVAERRIKTVPNTGRRVLIAHIELERFADPALREARAS